MGTKTSKIALNAHVHLRTENQHMSRPERHVDDITDTRRSCRVYENTSGRRPLGSSSRLLKVPNTYDVGRSCTWTLVMICPCHRSKSLYVPNPISCTLFFTLFVKVYLGFEFNFFNG